MMPRCSASPRNTSGSSWFSAIGKHARRVGAQQKRSGGIRCPGASGSRHGGFRFRAPSGPPLAARCFSQSPVDVVIAIGDVNVADEFAEQRQRRVDAVHHRISSSARRRRIMHSTLLRHARSACRSGCRNRAGSCSRNRPPNRRGDAEGRPGVWNASPCRVRARRCAGPSRVDAALDRVSLEADIFLGARKVPPPDGDADLLVPLRSMPVMASPSPKMVLRPAGACSSR